LEVNPIITTDSQGSFCSQWPFLDLLILFVFHTFFKLNSLNNSLHLRMDPTPHSLSFETFNFYLHCIHTNHPQAPSIRQLNSLDTRQNKHWHLKGKRNGCCACLAKKQSIRSIIKCVQNSTWGCVVASVLRHTTPNCMSEDQLTLNWKAGDRDISKFYHSCAELMFFFKFFLD
jgi:hypothetical protein